MYWRDCISCNILRVSLPSIEPSTGKICTVKNESGYIAIESIWNHTNYWVNMQDLKAPIQVCRLFGGSNTVGNVLAFN
jgi:hypothetical protein